MDNLIDERYGRWIVTGKCGRHLLIRCECGAESKALFYDLKSGKTTMCRGCKYQQRRGVSNQACMKHGLSDSPTQWVWSDMKRRCYNPGRRGYENYGGRGITICARWLAGEDGKSGLECFITDMGIRPSKGHQIEREDNDGHYTPENCRWVLRSEQDYNKRNTVRISPFGREMTLLQAEQEYGIKRQLIFHRMRTLGWSAERAVTTQPRGKTRL